MRLIVILVVFALTSCTRDAQGQPQTHADSIFSAIQTAVDIKSQTLPDGFQNKELYRLVLEDKLEAYAAQMASTVSMAHQNDSTVDDAGAQDVMMRVAMRDSIRRAKIVSLTSELLRTGTLRELESAADIMGAHEFYFRLDTTQLWCAYSLSKAVFDRGDTGIRYVAGAQLREYFEAGGSRSNRDSAMKSWRSEETHPNRDEGWIMSYAEALKQARATKRDIFIDFSGYTCTNARAMEQTIFAQDDVSTLMHQFVLVRLYIDNGSDENNRNAKMEEKRFHTLALPFYAIVSPNDKPLATFPGFTRDAEAFKAFLQLQKKYLWKK